MTQISDGHTPMLRYEVCCQNELIVKESEVHTLCILVPGICMHAGMYMLIKINWALWVLIRKSKRWQQLTTSVFVYNCMMSGVTNYEIFFVESLLNVEALSLLISRVVRLITFG